MTKKFLKIFQKTFLFLIITGIIFSNIPYNTLSSLIDSYEKTSGIVDKLWKIEQSQNDSIVDKFASARSIAEKFKIHSAMAAANYQGSGTWTAGTTALTVPWPTHAINDVALLFIENANSPITLTTPAGFTEITSSPMSTGTLNTAGGVRLGVYWARATSTSMASPVVAAASNHQTARIITFRGVIESGNPWDATPTTTVKSTASTTNTFPAITTTVANDVIVLAAALDLDANSTTTSSVPTNTNLTSIAELNDQTVNTGVGGGLVISKGLKATASTTGTSVSTVTSTISLLMTIALKPQLTTTISNFVSAEPGNSTIAPAGSAAVDSFGLMTSVGTDTVTAATVSLATGMGQYVQTVAITNSTGTTTYCSGTPTGDTASLTGCTIPVSTTNTEFDIKITADPQASLPAPPGGSYAVTATITGWTGSYATHAGTDSGSSTVTIDNASPGNVTSTTTISGVTVVDLAWTNPADSDFTTGGSVVVLRRQGSAVADVPAEATTYTVGNTIGTATVACVLTGSPPGTTCQDTGLTNGQAYHYKIFTKDSNGNYSVGVVPTGSPVTPHGAGACSSAGTGPWATGATWSAGCYGAGGIPSATDSVTILNGHNVTIATGVSAVAIGVTINNGGTLTITSTGGLSASGNFSNAGTVTGTGTLTLTGTGTTIDGTGGMTGLTGLTTLTNNKTINATASLSLGGALTISSGTTTNNGTISIAGTFTTTGNWTQGANSTLNVAGSGSNAITGAGIFSSSAVGNTVNYNLNGAQTCDVVDYYNLTFSNGGIKSLAGILTVNNALTISGGTLDTTSANNYTVNAGNILINGGTFTPNASTINLIGSSGTLFTKSSGTFTAGTSTVNFDAGSPWTQRTTSGSHSWSSIASSYNGKKLAASDDSNLGYIYTSTDYGVNWTAQPNTSSHYWKGVASSSDGTKLVAIEYGATSTGYIHTSTDSGVNWTEQTTAGLRRWTAITSSSDGTKIAATAYGGYIYTSTDSGVTWTEQTASGLRNWGTMASSSDGTKLIAGVLLGNLFISTDSGATWNITNDLGSTIWRGVASSADGTKLVAVLQGGYIYTSSNSGASWTSQTNSGSLAWYGVSSSSDGSKIAAVLQNGAVYTSDDYGVNWTIQTGAGSQYWKGVVYSPDGTKLIVGVYGGYIYTYSSPQNVTLSSGAPSFNNLTILGEGNRNLGENLTVGNLLTVTGGTLNTTSANNYTVNAANILINGGTFTANASTINLTGASGTLFTKSSGTFNAGTSTVNMANNGSSGPGTWTEQTNSGLLNWAGLASSSDGTKLAAITTSMSAGGYVYVSTNSGINWTQKVWNGSNKTWTSIASSSDGTKLVAVSSAIGGDYIYTSTDSGSNWTKQTSSGPLGWQAVTSSSDGTKLAAALSSGYIYTSTDSGSTWTAQTNSGSRSWRSIASSSDGTKLAAAAQNGYIYTSTDSGATWTEQTASGVYSWLSIVSSSDGTKLAAAVGGGSSPFTGYIYTSTDSGATWTQQTSAGLRWWTGITSSSDGTKLAARVSSGYIYISTDSGATWAEQTSAGSRAWGALASSSDGTKLAAGGNNGNYIYTYYQPPTSIPASSGSPSFYNLSTIGTGSINLGENLTATNNLSVTGGILDTTASNYTINTKTLTINGGELKGNASTINITGTGTAFNYTSGIYTAGTSIIKFTDSSNTALTFAGGSQTYHDIYFNRGTSTASNTISGSNTFADFKDDGTVGHSLLFGAGTTTTVTTFTVTGTAGNLITINSNDNSSTHTLTKAGGGIIESNYLNIQHSIATPSSTWYAGVNSIDNNSVAVAGSGWLFTSIPKDITISTSATTCTGSPSFTTTTSSCNVLNTAIQSLINAGTSVSFTAPAGNITVSSAIAKTSGGDVTMNMYAAENIIINADVTSTVGKLGLLLNADRDANSSGYINIAGNLTSLGGNITIGGGSGTISAGSGFAVGNSGQVYGIYVNNKTVAAGGGNIIANGQGYNTTTDNNHGVYVSGATGAITTTGSGTINITGNGGGITNSGSNYGLYVFTGAIISTVDGNLTVNGTGGGAGSGMNNHGVYVHYWSNTTIKTTGSGNLSIIGIGGNPGGTGGYNYGIFCNYANGIQTTGTGTLSVTGTGGNNSSGSGGFNYGVFVSGSITGNGGAMTISGTGGASSGIKNYGVYTSGSTTGISNISSGTLSITGNGAGITNSGSNYGLFVETGAIISTTDGNLTVNNSTGGGAGTGATNYGINIAGTNSTIKTTGLGNLSVTGTGGNASGSGSNNFGVYCQITNCIQTIGTGTISVTGTGGNGTSGSGTDNYGVYSSGSITGNGGAMTINGIGGASSGSNNYGVYVYSATAGISNVGSGTLSITGNGAGITNSASNYGLYVYSGSNVSTVDGNLTVSGTGGGTTSGTNRGVVVASAGIIKTTGSGNLIVNGVGNASSYGVMLNNANAFKTEGTGNITVNTDSIYLVGVDFINSIGSLTIAPYTASSTIGVAGGAGTLGLTSAYLGYLTYGTGLTIGNTSQTGTTTVGAYASWAKPITFVHNATGSIAISGAQVNSSTFNFDGPTTLSAGITASAMTLTSGTFAPGAQTITLTGTGTAFNYVGGTYTAGTSTIKFTDSSASGKTFAGGGQTYGNLWFAPGTGTGTFTISGSNTFANFKDDGSIAHSILFTTGTTQHITTWNVSGTAGNLITINSTTTGTHTLIKDGGGTITADYLDIQHSVVTPSNTWYADIHSVNHQDVVTVGSGWIFIVAQTSPTIVLNTADATNFGTDTTPTLEMTATDAQSDDVQYNIQISKDSGFTTTEQWIAVGDITGTSSLAHSSNGTTWTGDGKTLFTTYGNGIAYNGSMWVATGSGTNTVAYSTNGTSWTGLGTTVFSGNGYGVAWNGTMWVAIGTGTNSIAYSYNGIDWTGITGKTIFGTGGYNIAWNGTMWVATGQGVNSLAYSYNGIDWTGVTGSTTLFSSYGRNVAWGNGMWVATGAGTTNTVAYSSNGTSWTGEGLIFSSGVTGIAWNGTYFVITGNDTTSTIKYSSNGTSWTSAATKTLFSSWGKSVAWNGNKFVATGQGTANSFATSPNGIDWTGQGIASLIIPNAVASNSPVNLVPSIFSIIDKNSATDVGFLNTVNGGDTQPFTSGQKVSYTVQTGNEFTDGTYYWRARAIDPSGSNTYSSWTTANSFIVSNTPATFELSGFKFFDNINNTDVGSELSTQNSAATLNNSGNKFRLRALIHIGGAALPLNGQNFKLQYSSKSGTCDTAFSGESYTDVTNDTDMAYYTNLYLNNSTVLTNSGDGLTHSTDTIVNQSYVESNNFTNSIATIPTGQDGKWDFSLYDKGVGSNISYCFRIVKADGSVLNTYSFIPEIMTAIYRSRGGGSVRHITAPQCSDGIDNDSDTFIDEADPNCHLDGSLGNSYLPDWNSESTSPTIIGGGGSGGGTVVYACNDGVDNDSDTYTDAADPQCHMDGQLGNQYVPTWNSESIAPVTVTPCSGSSCSGGGGGGNNGDLGYLFDKVYSVFSLVNYSVLKNSLLGMAFNSFN